MAGAVRSLFGGDKASKRQERLLRQQEADLKATEAGQRRLREGGRGLLAFVDEEPDGGGLLGGALDKLNGKFRGGLVGRLMSRLGAQS